MVIAVIGLLKAASSLFLIYGLLPRLLFAAPRFARGPVDRFVVDVIRVTIWCTVMALVLGALGLFQLIGVIMAITAWVYFVRLRPKGITVMNLVWRAEPYSKASLLLLEAVPWEGNDEVQEGVRRWWERDVKPRFQLSGMDPRTRRALGSLVPLIGILLGAVYLRTVDPLTHVSLGTGDGYVHLQWIKQLQNGIVLPDGVYPMGMHAVLATADALTPASAFDLIRFGGPLVNVLSVLFVYLAAVRTTRDHALSLVPAAAVGLLGTTALVGLRNIRQSGTLPQEFAVMLALATVLMAIEYVQRPGRQRLVWLGLGCTAVSITHPVPLTIAALGAITAGLADLARERRIQALVPAAVASTVGVLVGHVYLVALLLGQPIYAAADQQFNPVQTFSDRSSQPLVQVPGALIVLAGLGALAGLLWGIQRLRRGDVSAAPVIAIAGVVFAGAALRIVGGRVVYSWFTVRWSELAPSYLPLGLAFGLVPALALLRRLPKLARVTPLALAAVVIVASVFANLLAPPRVASASGGRVEYESAAQTLDDIIRTNDRLAFTVVGPPTWGNRVLGNGFHVQLTDFADRLTLAEARLPTFQLPVDTKYVYVMVEKHPFRFPAVYRISSSVGRRYYQPESRAQIMDTVSRFMTTYQRTHPHSVSVLVDDADIRVWRVEQEANPDYADRYGLSDD